jgi:hypothetical protein
VDLERPQRPVADAPREIRFRASFGYQIVPVATLDFTPVAQRWQCVTDTIADHGPSAFAHWSDA